MAPTDAGALQRIVEALLGLTDGWEALIRCALEDGPEPWEAVDDPVDVLARPDGPVWGWVQETLLPALPDDSRQLLHRLADLHPAPRALVESLGDPGPAAYDALVATRVVVPDARAQPRVVPLVAACAQTPGTEGDAARWLRRAADWYAAAGHAGPALRAARRAGDLRRCGELIDAHGDEITSTGWGEEILRAAPLLPSGLCTLRTRLQWGHAARVRGRSQQARRILEGVLADTTETGEPPPPDLAWRLGLVSYGRGGHTAAAACCRGEVVPLSEPEPPADRVRRLACLSAALRAAGRTEAAETAAVEAVAATCDSSVPEDARSLALITRAVLLSGARRQNLLAEALDCAQHAGDLFLTQRALVNIADAHLVAAEYGAALEVSQRAVDLVDQTGPVGCFTVALHNGGEALLGLGRLAEARVRFLRCRDLARRNGISRTPAALGGLAEVDYQSGLVDDAQTGFEEAVELARETGDSETLVPALGRLATLLVTIEGDGAVDRARRLADEAVAEAAPDQRPAALVARGWVAVAGAERDTAARAAEAVESARAGQVRRALGEALELQATATHDPRRALTLLHAAVEAHERAGSALLADRVRVACARSPLATRENSSAGRAAARRLRRTAAADVALHPGRARTAGHAEVRVLGGFEVAIDGVVVPPCAWRSRQARTLLKLLVARGERPVPREEICENLWPGDDPNKTGHRLSVLLSSLRTALDPERRWPADHFIGGDRHGVRICAAHVSVDLQDFLADAEEAGRLTSTGEEQDARRLLAEVLAEHAGEAFEDDPYDIWATEVRDHVRAVRIQSLRTAARLAGRAGDIDDAATLLVRLLAVDPYDEPAHRLLVSVLVRTRRHGEARRAFDRWTRATVEVGATPPDAAILPGRALVTQL